MLAELSSYEDLPSLEGRIKALKDYDAPEYQTAARILEENPDFEIRHPRNLYDQTFWPDMEHNLLDWDKDITEDQKNRILDGLSNSAGEVNRAVTRFINNNRDDWHVDDETGEVEQPDEWADYPWDVAKDYLEQFMDFYEASGEYVYNQLHSLLGSAKAASEFLYSVGIHGITYIGDSSAERNYVAFSDKDIRIDRHIMFQSDRSDGQYDGILQDISPSVRKKVEKILALDSLREQGTKLFLMLSKMSNRDRDKGSVEKIWKDIDNRVNGERRKRLIAESPYMTVSENGDNPVYYKDRAAAERSAENARSLGFEVKVVDNPDYMGNNTMYQAKGDKFSAIRKALPQERGAAPLFNDRYNSVNQILPKLAEIFKNFPDSVTAADGASVLIKNPEGGVLAKRLMHLIANVDQNNGDRNSFSLDNKIPWLPRIVETLENAQAKIMDPDTGNFAYVRSYSEGAIHVVLVTPNGALDSSEVYDHALLTQFVDRFASRRDSFEVVWEKASMGQQSAQTASVRQIKQGRSLSNGGNGNIAQSGENASDKPKTLSQIVGEALSEMQSAPEESREVHRGATTFSGDWNATITLFEGAADASTLIHELGHYTFETMRKLVERGLADERMTDDWNKLLKFVGAKPGEALTDEQNEKLARAFEAYTMEGRAPSVELEGAFATLRYLLTQVYKSVKALGVKLNDEVRAVFDGLLATDEAADAASVINEAAREINAELLGLSQSEVKTYRELIEKANQQTIQELTAQKDEELRKLRPQWRFPAFAAQKRGKFGKKLNFFKKRI